MRVESEGDNRAPCSDLFGAVQEYLVAFVHAIEDANYYNASRTHLPIISELIRRCKNGDWFSLADFIFEKSDEAVIWRKRCKNLIAYI